MGAPRTVDLEIRRHAERSGRQEGAGPLSSAGLAVARGLRDPERRFSLIVSSPRERAMATADAIAGRVDEIAPAFDVTSDEVLTQAQFDAFATDDDVARFLGTNAASRRFAEAQLAEWESLARRLPDNGEGLVITHGGNIAIAATVLAKRLGTRFGRMPVGHCEGVRVHYLHGRPVGLERLTAAPDRHRPLGFVPPISVLHAFGGTEPIRRFGVGRGRTWVGGDVVMKPVNDEAEAEWLASLATEIDQAGFRLAPPVRSHDDRWVVDGWAAWTRVDGEHSTTRWDELFRAADAFHQALSGTPRPEFIARMASASRWRVADGIAWGERRADQLGPVRFLPELLARRRAVDLPAQLIHGDLVGNVLFAHGLPPAIIDLSLYWRPVGYSAALVIGDAVAWEGASPGIVRLIHRFDQWPQLLLRAVIFRIVVNALAERSEPWRLDVSAEYTALVDLVVRHTDPG